jgi:hypothetical protein
MLIPPKQVLPVEQIVPDDINEGAQTWQAKQIIPVLVMFALMFPPVLNLKPLSVVSYPLTKSTPLVSSTYTWNLGLLVSVVLSSNK